MVYPDTRVLFLGSFPGEESLRQQQYYAHPRNQFWRLLSDVFGLALAGADYRRRLSHLRDLRLGVWDVIARCERNGSLDGAIRHPVGSDFAAVTRIATGIELVCFNGQTAARARPDWEAAGYRTLVLPSSSPAYTRPYPEKLEAWREVIRVVGR